MGIWEKLFSPKKPELTPKQEREKRRVAIVREILTIEKRIEEVRKNVRMFGHAPADTTLLNNLQERIDKLNEKLVALGGKPVVRGESTQKQPPVVTQGPGKPIGRKAAESLIKETTDALAERLPPQPTKKDFGVIQGGKKGRLEEMER